jgi:hypothetical protein
MSSETFNPFSFFGKVQFNLIEYTPPLLNYLDAHPKGWLKKGLTNLANAIFSGGASDFPIIEENMANDIAQKPARKIHALAAPRAYLEAIGDAQKQPAQDIRIMRGTRDEMALHLKKYVNDNETGFRGAIYESAQGHAIVFFSGMNLKNGDIHDLEAIAQAKLMDRVNQQIPPAQELYLQAVKSSKSVEIVGYSLGSMLASDLAARLGAKATTLADIGLPDGKRPDGQSLYTQQQLQNVKDNVLALRLPNDPFSGKAGKVYGTIVELPHVTQREMAGALQNPGLTSNFNEQSAWGIHNPKAYMAASEKIPPVFFAGLAHRPEQELQASTAWQSYVDAIRAGFQMEPVKAYGATPM